MTLRTFTAIAFAVGLLASGAAYAQQQPPSGAPDLNAIPEKMPFDIPYGTPITMDRAQSLVQTAVAEANRRGWKMNVAVVDPNGDLIVFGRMDGAQLASISFAQHKARVAARYRRPTRAFEDAVQKFGFNYILTLDDVVASRGGIRWLKAARSSARSVARAAPARRTKRSALPPPIQSTNSDIDDIHYPEEWFNRTRVAAVPPSLRHRIDIYTDAGQVRAKAAPGTTEW